MMLMICRFFLFNAGLLRFISHRFWNTTTYWLEIVKFSYPFSFNAFSRENFFPISGSP